MLEEKYSTQNNKPQGHVSLFVSLKSLEITFFKVSDPKVLLLAKKVFLHTIFYTQSDSHDTGICSQDLNTPDSIGKHAMLIDTDTEKTIIVLMTITEGNCEKL